MKKQNGNDPKYFFEFGRLEKLKHELPAIYKLKNRYNHAYILGKTGMGKSVLLERMALNDIKHGISVIYIDPKGDSIKRLHHLAEDKKKMRYVSFEYPIVINPLTKQNLEIEDVINEFYQIIDILVTMTTSNPESTVLMREILDNAIMSFRYGQLNLDYLYKFLTYEDVRARHIETLTDPDLIKYWSEFDAKHKNTKYPKNKEKQESAKRIGSRIAEISKGKLRNIVNGENELDIADILDSGKSLLVDTSRMNMTSRIYLTNLIVYSVLTYMEYEKEHKKPLLVYVDEFQTVVSKIFSDLLARSRSAKVGFVLAHHDFEEVDRKILSSILGNVDTSVIFRCGDREAERFARIFDIDPIELINMDKYQAWVRIDNKSTLVKTYPPIMTEVPELDLPKPERKGDEVMFLRKEWIENIGV